MFPCVLECERSAHLGVTGDELSRETLDALGSLAGLAIERVRALEALSKNRAEQEHERLRDGLA